MPTDFDGVPLANNQNAWFVRLREWTVSPTMSMPCGGCSLLPCRCQKTTARRTGASSRLRTTEHWR